jgi:hypothetical protein
MEFFGIYILSLVRYSQCFMKDCAFLRTVSEMTSLHGGTLNDGSLHHGTATLDFCMRNLLYPSHTVLPGTSGNYAGATQG